MFRRQRIHRQRICLGQSRRYARILGIRCSQLSIGPSGGMVRALTKNMVMKAIVSMGGGRTRGHCLCPQMANVGVAVVVMLLVLGMAFPKADLVAVVTKMINSVESRISLLLYACCCCQHRTYRRQHHRMPFAEDFADCVTVERHSLPRYCPFLMRPHVWAKCRLMLCEGAIAHVVQEAIEVGDHFPRESCADCLYKPIKTILHAQMHLCEPISC